MKSKKDSKRINKAQLAEKLEAFFAAHPDETLSFKTIFRLLHIDTHPQKMLAIDIMEDMAWDDYLTKVSDSSYRLADNTQTMVGTFRAKASGRNSVLPDGSDKPIFVAERNSLFALNGDKVRITMMARRRNHIREAQVVEIIQRKTEQFVGRLQVEDGLAYLLPLEPMACNIFVPQSKLNKGKNGDRVVVKVMKWPDSEHRSIVAEVIDVLGPQGDNTAEMHAILAQFGLPYKYPQEVEEAANKISDKITETDLAEREDFREVWTCTIDPHDAKDFDDALSIRQLNGKPGEALLPSGGGREGALWEVGVHIADVSHYVTEGSVIDKEAQQRATSVYLVDRTIPMLPERLCNYICSLRPNEEKLAYSVIFTLDDEAVVKNYRIVHTVIKSNRRYAYEEVQAVIDVTARLQAKDVAVSKKEREELQAVLDGEPYKEQLLTLNRLAHKLRVRWFQNGSVRFEREELRFDIDETGKPTRCYFKKSLAANQLIEEFMLLANRTVAEHVGKVTAPRNSGGAKGKKPVGKTLPYRIHDAPDPQKMETLREFVAKFGHKLKSTGTKGATARAMNALMDEVEGRPEGNAIQMVALRAMMKAKYSTHNIGHFGLAFEYYTHFTSPIRRYPDMMVHRLLTRYENGGRSANQDKYEELCEHSSEMEQLAAQAERESIKYKMVEYMGQYLGEEFDAHISGITSHGIYCEIDDNHCEGMVSLLDLNDDYYEFDERNFQLVGRRRHNRYSLGDPIRIKVARANLERRQLDFVPAES